MVLNLFPSNQLKELYQLALYRKNIKQMTAFDIVANGNKEYLKYIFNLILNKAIQSFLEEETEEWVQQNEKSESNWWPQSLNSLGNPNLTGMILRYLILDH